MVIKMNLGQLVSLTHCKDCGVAIEIYPHQKSIKCPNCNKDISLICELQH